MEAQVYLEQQPLVADDRGRVPVDDLGEGQLPAVAQHHRHTCSLQQTHTHTHHRIKDMGLISLSLEFTIKSKLPRQHFNRQMSRNKFQPLIEIRALQHGGADKVDSVVMMTDMDVGGKKAAVYSRADQKEHVKITV